MNLGSNEPIAFIPTRDPVVARAFYEGKLGLRLESEDRFALVFRVGTRPGVMLRVVNTPEFQPVSYTIFGWQVDDITASVKELVASGIEPLRYGFFKQDELGIWSAPNGAQVAWFKDPDGNTLSVSQHKD
jgi:catechol 2,3-dioxygenase-like lactoylglutathione lyase family enzyme